MENNNEIMETLQLIINKIDENNKDIKALKQSVAKVEIKIESSIEQKLDALFDGYKQHQETLERVEKKIADLSDKVDKHDIQIQVIEGGKSKKAN